MSARIAQTSQRVVISRMAEGAGVDMTSRDSRKVDENLAFSRLGFTVYDALCSYRFGERCRIQMRIENLLAEMYTKRYQSLSINPES